LRQSGIPPERLANVSVPDAVRATSEWNKKLAAGKSYEMNKALATDITPHKEYPSGYKWVNVGPAGLEAEGKMMGHCVGSYCEDVKSRGTQILSLRDENNQPHVTVEVRPGQVDTYDWFHQQPNEVQNRIHADVQGHIPSRADINAAVRRSPEYQQAVAEAPPDIMQIKGKQNAAPVEKYLPYVQDLVRTGNWGKVRDLRNAGMFDVANGPAQYSNLPKYMTEDELRHAALEHGTVQGTTWEKSRALHAKSGVPTSEAALNFTDAFLEPRMGTKIDAPQGYQPNTAKFPPEGLDVHAEGIGQGYAHGGPVRMMSSIRTATTAPTINDPAIAHLRRVPGQPKPLRFAQGGSLPHDPHDDILRANLLKQINEVLHAPY
jgi:hypothetical protein